MRSQETDWGRLLSWPLDFFAEVGGNWTVVETFQRNAAEIAPTQSIWNMIERLAALEHEQAEENLEEVVTARSIEDDTLLQKDVVKTAARQLAQEIANDLAEARIEDFTRLITSEIIGRLETFIDNCRERGELSETEQLMVAEAEAVAERSYDLLQTWKETGEDLPETGEILTEPDELDDGEVEVLETEEEDRSDE